MGGKLLHGFTSQSEEALAAAVSNHLLSHLENEVLTLPLTPTRTLTRTRTRTRTRTLTLTKVLPASMELPESIIDEVTKERFAATLADQRQVSGSVRPRARVS